MLIVGAGASAAPPAELPRFDELRSELLETLHVDEGVAKIAVRLVGDVSAADEVVVVGYAGMDIDLRVVLGTALDYAKSVVWFASTGEWSSLQDRFAVLRTSRARPMLADEPRELTPLFLAWADGKGLTSTIPAEPRAAASHPGHPHVPPLHGRITLAAGLLVERCGYPGKARRSYRRAMLTGTGSARVAIRRLMSLDLYQPTRLARVAFWARQHRTRALMPRRMQAKLDRVHVTLLSSHQGRHEEALARSCGAQCTSSSAPSHSPNLPARNTATATPTYLRRDESPQNTASDSRLRTSSSAKYLPGHDPTPTASPPSPHRAPNSQPATANRHGQSPTTASANIPTNTKFSCPDRLLTQQLAPSSETPSQPASA